MLDYGRQSGAPPRPVPVDLKALIDESLFDAGLVSHPDIATSSTVPAGISIKADPDQLARVFVNLLKNAREALEAAAGKIADPQVSVDYAESPASLTVGDELCLVSGGTLSKEGFSFADCGETRRMPLKLWVK